MEMQSEIDQYRTRLRKALAEIDALQIKLKQSEANVRDVESVLRENRLLQEKYSLLEMQFKELQNQTKGVDRERYEAQLVSLKQANEQALKRVIELENELKNKDREYAQSRAEVLKYRQSVLDLTNDIKRLQHEISVLKVRAAAADDKKKLEFRIKELEVELAGKNQRIDQLMKLLQESTSSGNAANKALSEEIKRLQDEVTQLRSNAALESELRRRISDLTAAESELQKQLAAAVENMRLRDIEIKALKMSEEKLKQKLEKSKLAYNSLQDKDLLLQKEIGDLQKRYADLERRYQDRIKSDSLAQEKFASEKLALQKEIASLRAQSADCQMQLKKLAEQQRDNEQLIRDSRQKVIDLTAKLQSAEIELAKMRKVQKAYDELKAKFEQINRAANSDVMTALNRIPGLEEAIRRYEKENQQLIRQLAELKQGMSSYAEKYADASQRAAAAAQRAAAAEQKVRELEKSLRDARALAQNNQSAKPVPPVKQPKPPAKPVTPEKPKPPVKPAPQEKPAPPVKPVEETVNLPVEEPIVPPVKPQVVEPERIEVFLADGSSAEKRGNYEIAKWDYRQVLMRDPDNAVAASRLGVISCKEGDFAAAVKLLKPVVDPRKSSEELVHSLVRSFIGTRNYPAALKLLQEYKARRNGRMNARMLLAEAVAWSRSGKNSQAEQAFKMVLQLEPDNSEAPYELALMLSADKNRLREAGEFYRLARANGVEIDSYLEEVLGGADGSASSRDFLLSNMREALEKYDLVSAAWYLAEADKMVKNDIEVELMRDVYLLLDNKHEQVVKRLANSRDDRQKFLLALAHARSGDTAEAAKVAKYIPSLVKTALPGEVLKSYIKKESAAGSAGQRAVYNTLLKKLP